MPSSLLSANQLFAGRYRVLRCINAGGMGEVYEVLHLETERHRALKVMLPDLVNSPDLRDRFKREARVTANVESEFIVEVFDAGVDDATGMPFLVMELLHGEELGDLVERTGALKPRDVLTYLRQAAMALERTHAASIVHRDLKPENLFLTHRDDGSPRIKVLDFGISKVVSEANTRAHATQSLGTPLYMAPEQFVGEGVGIGTDIYALALIAYTLLVGAAYWAQEASSIDNVFAFAARAAQGPKEPATVRAARRGVTLPAAFDDWFLQATDRDPARRPARATALVSALAKILGCPDLAEDPGPVAAVTQVAGSPTPAQEQGFGFPTAASTVAGTSLDAAAQAPSSGSKKGLLIGMVGLGAVLLVGGGLLVVKLATGSSPAPARSSSTVTPPETNSAAVVSPSAAVSSPPEVTSTAMPEVPAPSASAPVVIATAKPPVTGRKDPQKTGPSTTTGPKPGGTPRHTRD